MKTKWDKMKKALANDTMCIAMHPSMQQHLIALNSSLTYPVLLINEMKSTDIEIGPYNLFYVKYAELRDED